MANDSENPPTASMNYIPRSAYAGLTDPTPRQLEGIALSKRIARERALYEQGFPVAGHDFAREAAEREQDRDRDR